MCGRLLAIAIAVFARTTPSLLSIKRLALRQSTSLADSFVTFQPNESLTVEESLLWGEVCRWGGGCCQSSPPPVILQSGSLDGSSSPQEGSPVQTQVNLTLIDMIEYWIAISNMLLHVSNSIRTLVADIDRHD